MGHAWLPSQQLVLLTERAAFVGGVCELSLHLVQLLPAWHLLVRMTTCNMQLEGKDFQRNPEGIMSKFTSYGGTLAVLTVGPAALPEVVLLSTPSSPLQ
jgi:hypothetical protein